ncbi:MAG TPA: AMP-binding protein, partial [Amycolatopsis sp.]|nr:AMP-binding protein [Amycolatopsis sp.]
VVAQLARPCADAYLAWIGVALAGGLEVPLNVGLTPDLLAAILRDARPRVLVADADLFDGVRDTLAACTDLKLIILRGGGEGAARVGNVPVVTLDELPVQTSGLRDPEPRDTACVLYTSGTTGTPKGVLVPWAMFSSATSMVPPDLLGDAIYAPWPVFHVTGKSCVVQMAACGGRVVTRDTVSTSRFWADVRRYRCTHAVIGFVVPILERAAPTPQDADHALRSVVMGPLVPDVEAFSRRFGVRVVVVYGSTEMGFPLVLRENVDNRYAGTTAARERPGYHTRVVDENGEPVPDGSTGELQVRADAPEVMAVRYLDGGAVPRVDGWFPTGDAFHRGEDGLLWFDGRLGERIRRRGENLSALDVEAAALEHADVVEAAAFGVPGEPDDEIHLVLVPGRAGARPDDVHDWLTTRLPKFMWPRYLTVRDSLPKTATHRIRKSELATLAPVSEAWDAERRRR